jgi:hypothetical protein
MMQQSAMHHTAECYAPYRKAVEQSKQCDGDRYAPYRIVICTILV